MAHRRAAPILPPPARREAAPTLWAVCFWLALWQLAAMAFGHSFLLPTPTAVAMRLLALMGEGAFWRTVWRSLWRIALGFLLALVCGTALAVAAARLRWLDRLLAPPLAVIRATPVASFIILALVWVPSRNLSTLICFLMVLPILYSGLREGLCALDDGLRELAAVFALPWTRRVRYLSLPQLFPFFRAACAASLGLCWKSGVAAEIIGLPTGTVGERLQQAKIYFDTPDMFGWTLVVIVASFLCSRLFLRLLDAAQRRLERM